jgi:predicted enzyme related to lactoylglutathione lyase
MPRVDRPGDVTYLHIPASDGRRSASFYAAVFGWAIRDPHSDSPAFADRGGHVIGHFVDDLPVAGASGVRPYIYVDDVGAALARVEANDGQMVKQPFAEGDLTVAHFADPAGNVLGLWQFAASSRAS